MTTESENKLAATSTVTPEEIRVLFQGERRGERRLSQLVWDDSIRHAKKQLMMEELSDD